MRTLIILLKIFFIGALLIISNGNLALADADNRDIFYEKYYNWLSELFGKGATVVGYVVSTEWLPDIEGP